MSAVPLLPEQPLMTLVERAEQDLIACDLELDTWHWHRPRCVKLVAALRNAIAECRRTHVDDGLYATYCTAHSLIQGWRCEDEFQRIFKATFVSLRDGGGNAPAIQCSTSGSLPPNLRKRHSSLT